MALDVIRNVGPRGLFLKHRHTREKLKQRAYSGLTGQVDRSGLVRDPLDVARQKVELILKHHHPQPLEAAQRAELTRILAAADREIGGII
jgi:trimethylamine:corrinoid methyltransferase-like protein